MTARFSLIYVMSEDRIAWDAEDAGGATARLWLTHRFCREFVAAIIPRLPRPASAEAHAAVAQRFEQAAAMAQYGKTSGVKVGDETTAGLVRSVQIRPQPGGLMLVFEFGDDQKRELALSAAAARQMLGVMHRLFVGAGWPLDIWPDWVADPTPPGDPAALN